ncbi:MAG: tyrosine-protein phosphatase [Planctomycetota bacterium]
MPRSQIVLVALMAACATQSDHVRLRPAHWAQPVLGGVQNWHRVSDDLYRAAQPSSADMRTLQNFGVRSIVNLREFHSDRERLRETRLHLVEHPLATGHVGYQDLVAALRKLLDAPKPALVHCWHGSDRTGAVCAAWRIAIDGWSPSEALDEMVAGGFGHSSYYDNLRVLIARLDADRLRRDAGVE